MIIGEHINLRALQRQDRNKVLEWVNNPEIKKLIGGIFPISEIEHEKWFESRVLDPINKLFAIELSQNNTIIGIIGLKNVDLINRSSEIYVYIGDKEYWGKGYGTESIKLLVEFCINELNLHRLYLYVFDYNKRAIASYKKVGFKIEGVLRDSLYRYGKYHNSLLMSVLRSDLED